LPKQFYAALAILQVCSTLLAESAKPINIVVFSLHLRTKEMLRGVEWNA